jgi:hypothetical protein
MPVDTVNYTPAKQNSVARADSLGWNNMKSVRKVGLVALLTLFPLWASASTDPVADVTGASTTASTAWSSFAAISASAFIFAMVIGYARKAKK